jgi:hypothetical protein
VAKSVRIDCECSCEISKEGGDDPLSRQKKAPLQGAFSGPKQCP